MKFNRIFCYILFALACLMAFSHRSEAQTDSLYMEIDEAVFISHENTSAFKMNSAEIMEIDVSRIQDFPKILGNTDPINFIKLLSGVSTASEHDSGINIQGCDNAHNEVSLSGVPIYGAAHLFGLFSVFNPSHYKTMNFSRSSFSSDGLNRLGGAIVMELPDTLERKFRGEVSVGIMSAQGTLAMKAGKRVSLHLSARQSFLNLLYKRWLKIDGNPMRYGFGDYNLTCVIDAGGKDKVWIDGYFGMDKAYLGAGNYNIDLSVDWGNLMGGLHWEHKGDRYTMKHSAYISGYGSEAEVYQENSALMLPSSIATAGYRGKMAWGNFVSGGDVTFYKVRPQAPARISGSEHILQSSEVQYGTEADIYADYNKRIAYDWNLKAGLKAVIYRSPEKELFWNLSPAASVSYNAYRFGKVTLSYAWQHQYLFYTGLSNVGLPMNFWFLAGNYSRPQSAHSVALGYELRFSGDMYALTADLYFKRLYNQVEYNGNLFELLNSSYDLNTYLLKGAGRNYGLSVMFHKQSGDLTGWVSYSIGRALRMFDNPEFPGVYPANHERIHELKLLASYDYRKWNFSGTFICASGLPFTAPDSFYLSSGNLITRYGDYNAARMRPYVRLDLSVNKVFRKDRNQENGINFSVYNALACKNEIMWRMRVAKDKEKGGLMFSYSPLSFYLQVMPSISYYHKF